MGAALLFTHEKTLIQGGQKPQSHGGLLELPAGNGPVKVQASQSLS